MSIEHPLGPVERSRASGGQPGARSGVGPRAHLELDPAVQAALRNADRYAFAVDPAADPEYRARRLAEIRARARELEARAAADERRRSHAVLLYTLTILGWYVALGGLLMAVNSLAPSNGYAPELPSWDGQITSLFIYSCLPFFPFYAWYAVLPAGLAQALAGAAVVAAARRQRHRSSRSRAVAGIATRTAVAWSVRVGRRVRTARPLSWLPLGIATATVIGAALVSVAVAANSTPAAWNALAWTVADATAISDNGSFVFTVGPDGQLQLWDVSRDEQLRVTADPSLSSQLALSSALSVSQDKAVAAFADAEGAVWLWSLGGGAPLKVALSTPPASHFKVSLSADGRILATAASTNSVTLWNMADAAHPAQLGDLMMDSPVESIAFSPNGRMLASGSADGAVRLWDAGTGRPLATLAGAPRPVVSLAFSPDGNSLAEAGSDGTVWLWQDLAGRRRLQTLGRPPVGTVSAVSVTFAPDQRSVSLLLLTSARKADEWMHDVAKS